MADDFSEYWPHIRRLALEGGDLAAITGHCVYSLALPGPLPTLSDVAALVLRHEEELAGEIRARQEYQRRDAELRRFDIATQNILAVAQDARRDIKTACGDAKAASVAELRRTAARHGHLFSKLKKATAASFPLPQQTSVPLP